MKVILAKPPIPKESVMLLTLPMGLAYLGSYLKRCIRDTQVTVIDSDLERYYSIDEFISRIRKERPDVLGITVFSHTVLIIKELITRIRNELSKDLIIVAGGPHVNAVRQAIFMDFPEIDFGLLSDGEPGLVELVNSLKNDSLKINMKNITGLVYRENGNVHVNPNIYNQNLDDYDFIDYQHIVDVSKYFKIGSPMGLFHSRSPVATIITTRGCPFLCRFCASALNTGRKVRCRTPGHVVQEIKLLVQDYGVKEIHIMDDNFTYNKQHVLDICQGIINENLDVVIAMPNGIRLDTLDEEMLLAMKKAGFYSLGFGIESSSDATLKYIVKQTSIDFIKNKIRLCKKIGFQAVGFFILGFPNESEKDLYNSGRFPDQIGLDFASFGNFTPLPGTSLYRELVKKGEISDNFLPSFSSGEVTYSPKGITKEQLKHIQARIIFCYYLHPKRIIRIMRLLKMSDIKFVWRRLFLILFRPKIKTGEKG